MRFALHYALSPLGVGVLLKHGKLYRRMLWDEKKY
jgi:hypothetical protein